jgi:hypothetical protein
MVRMGCLMVVSILVVFASAYAEGPEISGLIQSQYVDEGHKDSQFLVKAARLRCRADITDRVTGKLQVDFAREPVILDAMVDIAVVQYANFTVGQFTIPFGYEFQLSRFDLEAIDRSLIMKTAFGNGVSSPYVRDVGVMVTGRYKLFDYEVAAVNGTGYDYHNQSEEASGVFANWNNDNNNAKDIVGRIGIGVPMFAGLGFSVYEGKWVCDREKSAMGFYFHLEASKLLLQYEWLRGKGYLGEAPPIDTYASGDSTGLWWYENKYGGYYLIVGYRVTPMIEPTFKIDKLDPDKDEGGDTRTDLYYGLNLDMERRARLQVFYRDSKEGGDFIGKGWRAQVSARF